MSLDETSIPAETTAYCFKCRTNRPLAQPAYVFTARGQAATRGVCPECGTTLFRMGETPHHAGLERPAVTPTARGKPGKSGKTTAKTVPAQHAPSGNGSRRSGFQGSLVIVESPAKARTVERILGRGYRVRASVGHVRDLLRSQLSVDVEHDFEPKYRVPNEKAQIVKEIKSEAAAASQVFLATDPDREGEAIAWHLMEAADIDAQRTRRVVFHEITEEAVREAFSHSRVLDMDLVNAQQTRRILDRLVGYKISPLLWDRVRSRTSAGRVQSVAVRLIVEREREIQAFVSEEYWSIAAELAQQLPPAARKPKARPTFIARLIRMRGAEVDLKNETDTRAIVDELERATYQVTKVKLGERRRKPAAPFTTSTLQQEASRQLGYTARQTMLNAQILYEGVDLGAEGSVGLITYMRTDSTNVARVAQEQARDYILAQYGPEYVPETPPQYKTRAKVAQEAHEAIRPTSVLRTPESVQPYLKRDLYRLYELIWKRFVASQMEPAVLDTVTVDVEAGPAAGEHPYLLRATGVRVRFPGFLVVYEESRDEDVTADGDERWLPDLAEQEWLDLIRLLPEQHFTQPPPRYTEASLVRTLEENGIGRPSTYAPIISTIQQRGYVERRERRLYPTELGFVVNDLLVKYFPDIIDVGFTARMEEHLDSIASGEEVWVPVLHDFWGAFSQDLARAEATMEQVQVDNTPTGEICDKCGSPMVIKHGRFGKFIACSNYPECKNTKPLLAKIGVTCPQCGGDLVERRSRRGRTFYGCANYPQCDFSSWTRPVPTPCPHCGGLMVVAGKQAAKCLNCGKVSSLETAEDTLPAASPVLVGG